MGWVFTIIAFVVIGSAALLGWWSVDQICGFDTITEPRAQGVLGLCAVSGFIVGGVLQAKWG